MYAQSLAFCWVSRYSSGCWQCRQRRRLLGNGQDE